MKPLSWINCLLGLWLIVASFVLSTRAESVVASVGIAGIAIAVLAYTSAVRRPSAAVSWAVAGVALWLLIIDYGADTPARLNATVVGLIVLVLGSANAIYQRTPRRSGA